MLCSMAGGLCLGPSLGTLRADAKSQPLTDENRIAIIRGVSSEFARARVSLPRGKTPLLLDQFGNYDESSLKSLLMKYGPAVDAGQQLQITRIEFRNREILFEINGGGKKKGRWTDHLQLSVGGVGGPASRTDPQAAATGSSVLLRFEGDVPNLTADQVKQLLGQVLNFNPQSAARAYADTLPPEFKEALEKHEARVGMNRDMVIAALGRPSRKIREKNAAGIDQEQWIYGEPPAKVTFVVFEEDRVVSIKEY
ncbi:MAG: hypothetical protein PHX83_12775 [Acidobacteriia bacterium]|nr:hypothetical protein [Terriglobia bacterium]